MKFSKWGSWNNRWLFEFLPRVSFKPTTTTYSYSTERHTCENGFKGSKRIGPVTEHKGSTLTFAWLCSSLTFQWDDSRVLSEEESLEHDNSKF